jgi:hypothetical protein
MKESLEFPRQPNVVVLSNTRTYPSCNFCSGIGMNPVKIGVRLPVPWAKATVARKQNNKLVVAQFRMVIKYSYWDLV